MIAKSCSAVPSSSVTIACGGFAEATSTEAPRRSSADTSGQFAPWTCQRATPVSLVFTKKRNMPDLTTRIGGLDVLYPEIELGPGSVPVNIALASGREF